MRSVSQGARGPGAARAARRAGADGRDGRGGHTARLTSLSVTGAIIAGGKASRLAGRPKGLEIVGGARIIDRVAAALSEHCSSLLIAPGSLDATGWLRNATIAPDRLPVKASITGIHAAIAAAGSDVVAVAWDMPFVPSGLIGELVKRLDGSATAVVPVVDGRPEPLCAAYSTAAVEPIADAVSRGTLRNADVLAGLTKVIWLDESELRRFGEPDVMFFNVNTAADLITANERATR